jgi:NADPH:quinone reductase-like Zn-dependent oxidoreductase
MSWVCVREDSGLAHTSHTPVFLVTAERSAKDLDEVIALAAQAKYRAVVDNTFPMSEVAEATRYLDERKAIGKVVLTF